MSHGKDTYLTMSYIQVVLNSTDDLGHSDHEILDYLPRGTCMDSFRTGLQIPVTAVWILPGMIQPTDAYLL